MDRWQERVVHGQARVLGQLRRRGILIEEPRLAEGADFVLVVIGVVQPTASLECLGLGAAAEDDVSAGPL